MAAETPPDASPRNRPEPRERPRADRAPEAAPGDASRRALSGTLDERQRDLLREAMQTHGEGLRQLDEKLRLAQRELMQAILTEKQDEATIRQKADTVAKLQTEQTLLRAKVFAVVVPTLKPEQRELIENSPFAFGMLMGTGTWFRNPIERPGDRPADRRSQERQVR
jgi:hypothetical protein